MEEHYHELSLEYSAAPESLQHYDAAPSDFMDNEYQAYSDMSLDISENYYMEQYERDMETSSASSGGSRSNAIQAPILGSNNVYLSMVDDVYEKEIDYLPIKDWQAELQELLRMEDSHEKWHGIARLGLDFQHAASLYARVIVSECKLAENQKTIRTANVGGVAGGIKVICQGILFKVAVDKHGMYGNDGNAAKAAGHEFKSTTAFFDLQLPDVQLPLMAIIDYRGFRVTAMSLLPISGQETLVYGSSDGGRTVTASDPYFNQLMERAGKLLNLKPHLCGKENPKVLWMPIDVEGHATLRFRAKKPSDGESTTTGPTTLNTHTHRGNSSTIPKPTTPPPPTPNKRSFVVLDLARLFPPQMPLAPPEKGSKHRPYLYQLLRPEYVKSNPVPLSSDAFSPFNSVDPNAKQNNEEVAAACHRLVAQRIPQFASFLEKGAIANLTPGAKLDCTMLVSLLHRHGINIRFLAVVRRFLRMPRTRRLVLTEMVCRVVKDQINEALRNTTQIIQLPVEEPYKDVVVEYLNRLFGSGADKFWKSRIVPALFEKFNIKSLDLDMENDIQEDTSHHADTSSSENSSDAATNATPPSSSASITLGNPEAPAPTKPIKNSKKAARKAAKAAAAAASQEPNLKLFIDLPELWDRVSLLTGVVLRSDSLRVMMGGLGISSSDVKRIDTRVRVTDVLNRALAISVALDAKKKKGTEAYRYYLKSHRQFQECLEVSAANAATFYYWGKMLHEMSQHDSFRRRHSLKLLRLGALPKLSQAVQLDPNLLDAHAELAWSLLDFLLHPMRFEMINKTTTSIALKDTTNILERAGTHLSASIGDGESRPKPGDLHLKTDSSNTLLDSSSEASLGLDGANLESSDSAAAPQSLQQQIESAQAGEPTSSEPTTPAETPRSESPVHAYMEFPTTDSTSNTTKWPSTKPSKKRSAKEETIATSSDSAPNISSPVPSDSVSRLNTMLNVSVTHISSDGDAKDRLSANAQRRLDEITKRIDSASTPLFMALSYAIWEHPRFCYALQNRGSTLTDLELLDASFLPKFGFLLIPQVCPNLTRLCLRNAVFLDSITASQMFSSSETVELEAGTTKARRAPRPTYFPPKMIYNKIRSRVKAQQEKRAAGKAALASSSSAFLPSLPNLKILQLQICDHLTDIDDFEAIHWPDLESLELLKCGLSDGFFQTRLTAKQLPSLTHLGISGSNITDLSLTRLAAQFGPYLRNLNLSVCTTMTGVSCYNAMIHNPTLNALKSLTRLDFSGCHLISAQSILNMAKAIFSSGHGHGHSRDHVLQASSSSSSSLPAPSNSKSIPRLGMASPSASSASIPSSPGQTHHSATLNAMLHSAPASITSLNFAGCSALTEDIFNLFPKRCPLLREINVDKTAAGGQLLQLLAQHCPHLEQLHAQSCRKMEPLSLLKVLQGCPLLTELDASYWNWNQQELGPKLAKAWTEHTLPSTTALELLYISAWNMDSALIQLLYTRCPKLKTTDISGCLALGPEVFSTIAQHCKQMEKVVASGLMLSDDGVEALTQGCKELKSLVFARGIDLSDMALESLSRCPGLTKLNLTYSAHITNQGVQTLISAVPSITKLGLRGCKLITSHFIYEKLRHSCNELIVDMDATKVVPWSFPLP